MIFYFKAEMIMILISISIIEHLCSRYCAEHFILVNSFSPQITIEDIAIIIPISLKILRFREVSYLPQSHSW